ncbi:TRAPP II complex [Sphaerosporella brunnea]|uniref:TRAPP II complex n=1 Tax=Sphaerosporella brunnea TaxID=1250544 RepID=A0A5J5ELG0_9PEZI|nr:TRAPP II complex [Sphaerosporella brunnea]
MALDSLSFITPARLRALVCPLGRIRRSRFSSFVRRLQAANVVRLGDVTPDSQVNRAMFSPQGFPDGQIMWDLTTSVDREHQYLETFEMHRRTFVVIAVADYDEECEPERMVAQLDEMKSLYPSALYHVCLIFDAPAEAVRHEKLKSDGHPRFLAVPTKRESKLTSMRTLMCDITAPVLSEMSAFAKSIQAMPTLESPLSPENRNPAGTRDRRNSVPTGGGLTPFGVDSMTNKRKTMGGFGGGSGGGGGASSPSERARIKGKGRVQVAIAQLHLIAGRVPDAVKEFVEGADVCRASNDHLWHGKALEGIGICLVLLANLGVQFQIPTIPYPTVEGSKSTKSSPAPSKPSTPIPTLVNGAEPGSPQQVMELLPELHKNIVNLYLRASNFSGESVPNISYCETILRHAKLLTSLYLSNGVARDAIAHVVFGTPIPHKGPRRNAPPRMEIEETAMRAYPQPVEIMTVLEATKVLSGIASVLGIIGMKRRKAFVTRELVRILIPGLIQARVVGAAEAGIHPAAGLSAISGGHGSPLDLGEGDVESGVMELLEELCRAYGVLPGLKGESFTEEEQRPSSSGTLMLKTSVWTKAVISEQEIRTFGWPALKIQVLRSCMALCEALPDFQGVLNFTTMLLRTADMELTREEQVRLSTTVSRTVGAARKLGIPGVEADYWDQFLLRDIELVENTTWRPPIAHNRSELMDPDMMMSPTSAIEAEKTPFIYNPFRESRTSAAEKILVKGEPAEFKVTLQNPFEFEVEVASVILDATGVDLEAHPASVVIAPFRTYQVSVFATPNGTGDVNISGCRIRVYGCKERFFPILTGGLDPRERDTKTKRFGLKAAEPRVDRPLSQVSASGRGSLRPPPVLHPIPKTLSLTVVHSQPLLVVKNTSLSQSALMVLEGERRIFQITLRNLSAVDVDLLVFSFTDSTTGRIQQALAEKSNTPAETYELELMLEKKRAFSWHRPRRHPASATPSPSPSPTSISAVLGSPRQPMRPKVSTQDLNKRKVYIPASGEATFEIEVLGKPGLTHGTIQVDYSHLGSSRSEVSSRFYTRQVIYPVTVTVNASIELARVDFIPFSTDFVLSSHSPSSAAPFKQLFDRIGVSDEQGEYCLMLMDLRNAWPQPLRVRLALSDAPHEPTAFEAEDILQAGHTSRIILPVKRIFLKNPYAQIPSISASQRQFVVSTTKISVEQERQSREAFWYREELLKRIAGSWEELGTERTGDIELRGIRLSPRMVETLRVEEVSVAVAVKEHAGAVQRVSPSKFVVATDRFLTLTATVTNRTARPVKPVLRLLPSMKDLPAPQAFELGRRLAVNGILQRGLDVLPPGESVVAETDFVVLAKGEYEVSASVEEVRGAAAAEEPVVVVETVDAEGRPLDVLGGRGGRRCWVCREVCLLVARDVAAAE